MKTKQRMKQQPTGELAEMSQQIAESAKSEAVPKWVETIYTNLINSSPVGIYIIQDKRFVFVNPQFQKDVGYTAAELLGSDPLRLVHPEDREQVRQNAVEMLQGKHLLPYEYRAIGKSGEEIWAMEKVISIQHQGRRVALGYFMNISERKRAEEELKKHRDHLEELVKERTRELREAEERFSGIFDASKDAIGFATLEGVLLDVNDAFCQLTGYPREDFLSGRVSRADITPEEYNGLESKITEQVIETGKPEEYEKEYTRKDGSRIPVLSTTFVVKGDDGKPIGLAAITKDITESKQLQERLLTSERLATLGQFSGNISHELRNPLGVIDSSAFFLKTKLKDADEKVQLHLDRIRYSVRGATAIIESLLSLTRMKEPKLEGLDLVAIVHDAIVTSKVTDTVEVIRNFPEQEVVVSADREQLRMAFKNIIKNADEAMDGSGTLTVTLRTTADGQAEVSVADTGPGIALENLDRVFQPLFSTRASGIGFGLSIAKMVIDKHGGAIEVESEPGKGATFIIRLPLYA